MVEGSTERLSYGHATASKCIARKGVVKTVQERRVGPCDRALGLDIEQQSLLGGSEYSNECNCDNLITTQFLNTITVTVLAVTE